MNTYNFNDENFKNTDIYKNFITSNPRVGYLKIRAYGASQALPISNLKIVVSKNIGNNNIIFFEGNTNSSGVIERITLPAPIQNNDDLTVPSSTTYDITATYQGEPTNNIYRVNMYENIYVIQTISIVPDLGVNAGDNIWL